VPKQYFLTKALSCLALDTVEAALYNRFGTERNLIADFLFL
jgi:hypothetical protein